MVKNQISMLKLVGVEGEIPSINDLATSSALTAVENKIPYISGLVKKTDFDTKVTRIESKIPSMSAV